MNVKWTVRNGRGRGDGWMVDVSAGWRGHRPLETMGKAWGKHGETQGTNRMTQVYGNVDVLPQGDVWYAEAYTDTRTTCRCT